MNREKILNKFFEYPRKKFHIRELARLTKLNPNTVSKFIKELIKENLLIKNKTKVTFNVWANLENSKFFFERRIHNIKKIYHSNLIDFLVKEYNHPDAIVLYGSYSRGENFEKSDIDIAIVTKKELKLDLSKFEKKLGNSIHLVEVDLTKSRQEFINNLVNGFVIYGYLKVK